MANSTSSLITTTTAAATTTSIIPPRLSGYVNIDRSPRCIVPEEHFGPLAPSSSLFSGDKEHEDNATAPPSPPFPNHELKEIVGFYLAPRHIAGANLAPAAATTATAANKKLAWLPVRFLRVDPLRNKSNEETDWQPLPAIDTRHAQHHHDEDYHCPQQNAQKRPQQQGVLACSTASITYWLAPYPNSVSLMLRLQASTYAEGEDYAVCPYLSIEYQLDGEHTDEEAVTRLSKAGGAALYNRFLLHERKASKNGAYDGGTDTEMKQGRVVGGRDDCGERDDDTIRHYCIVIGWEKFSVWVIRPTRDSRALDTVEAPPAASSKTIMSARSSTKPKPEPEPGNTARAPRSWHGGNNIAPNSSLVSHSNHYVSPDSSINNAVQRSRNWRGAQMMRLTGININELSKDLLPQWIERIHRWGTTAYANAVEMDLGWAQIPSC
ncbi:hypothetical protein UCRPA7_3930 [Phaeoacremonium minimum UCRPA7]|uniref:Uncharacterized protein n=1 Tax=Phaeoacremonium minimum (strain UCR-PA7) TaxID=1286976 RepID=R8BMJ1_PHAM7|nr:hypothetical protein UCRPA7_3930 [Phaeoacremonium minimum UCRPA7]EOO00581.1 hypothetical protein UCRPA7_3930 [Phaeoacremonium minimum UCRPA7]